MCHQLVLHISQLIKYNFSVVEEEHYQTNRGLPRIDPKLIGVFQELTPKLIFKKTACVKSVDRRVEYFRELLNIQCSLQFFLLLIFFHFKHFLLSILLFSRFSSPDDIYHVRSGHY